MLDNQFRSLKDNIEKHIHSKLLGFEIFWTKWRLYYNNKRKQMRIKTMGRKKSSQWVERRVHNG
jgi:hypothetical protein